MPYRIPELAGKPYQPSNGTEGMVFMDGYCDRCIHDVNSDCPIVANTLVYNVDDPEYPKEWTHDADGEPTCTAFEEESTDV